MIHVFEYLRFLSCFDSYRELEHRKHIHLPHTNVTLSSITTLFGYEDLYINDEMHTSFQKSDEEIFEETITPLIEILAKEEQHRILKTVMHVSEISDYPSFQQFLKEGIFNSPVTLRFLETNTIFQSNEDPDLSWNVDDLKEEFKDLCNLSVVFTIQDDDDSYEFSDWSKKNSLRLKVITGHLPNPNTLAQDKLNEFFNHEESIRIASTLPNVSTHYSDFESNTIAFNIKVHEMFAHEGLYELKLISEYEESDNRRSAIEDLIDFIADETNFAYSEQRGSSGGYLCFKYDSLTPKEIHQVHQIIEEATASSYKYYQTLDAYDYRLSDIVAELEEMHDDDAITMLSEIKEYQKTAH